MENSTKICLYCGRSFAWRRKWAQDWESVKFCSSKCKKTNSKARNEYIEESVLKILSRKWISLQIIVSEIVKQCEREVDKFEIHAAARRLALADRIELQSGPGMGPVDINSRSLLRCCSK